MKFDLDKHLLSDIKKLYNISSKDLLLNINKPANISSAKLVSIVKSITKSKKVGHGGTLDPMATGVLPIGTNKCTKLLTSVVSHEKEYLLTLKWGEFRDTDDLEGKIVETSKNKVSNLEILNILPEFIGEITQVPPIFSAIKVNGKRSYKRARLGEMVVLQPRKVMLYKIVLLKNNLNEAIFKIKCGKGFYVRSFVRDLAKRLNSCAYLHNLQRVRVGSMTIEDSVSINFLKNIINYHFVKI